MWKCRGQDVEFTCVGPFYLLYKFLPHQSQKMLPIANSMILFRLQYLLHEDGRQEMCVR